MAPIENFLFLEENELDQPVHRYMHVDRFLKLLDTRTNTLVKPRLWDDPFENFLLNSTMIDNEGRHLTFGYREDLFGQCWTFTQEESDAMWRIYCPDKMGVRVTSTPRKLLEGIYDPKHEIAQCCFFIGKVLYLQETEIRQFLNTTAVGRLAFDTQGRGQAKSLLMKRDAFRHENEVRLLYLRAKSDSRSSDVFPYDFAPQLLDTALFDPRMSEHTFQALASYASNTLKWAGQMSHSTLYEIPNLVVDLRQE